MPTTIGPRDTRARQRREHRRRIWRYGLAMVTALLVLAGAVYTVQWWQTRCATGVAKEAHECVGVTDGSYVFDPALKDVEAAIKVENDRIAGQRAVTVALLMPMTTSTDLMSAQQIRSHLEGAYVAQREGNGDGADPKIRLVLANEGSQEQSWQPVVDQLGNMVHDDAAPLVAVTGLGVSVTETAHAARALANQGIPMVASVASADGLNRTGTTAGPGGPVRGLTRVMTSNHDEVASLSRYLGADPPAAMLVVDDNPDDLYATTLADDFKSLPETKKAWEKSGSRFAPYDAAPGSSGIVNEFEDIANRLCDEKVANWVLYAGRASLLPDFISRLGAQNCANPITVVTGSDATGLQGSPATQTGSGVSVIYSGVENPVALRDQRNPDRAQYQRFEQGFQAAHFASADLDAGWAIMGHDALQSAVVAIQKAVRQLPSLPSTVDVAATLHGFNDENHPIHGASGTFWFDSTTGDRAGPLPPVLDLAPHATTPTVIGWPPR